MTTAADQFAGALAGAHINLTRFFAGLREAFARVVEAIREAVKHMGDLIAEFKVLVDRMRRRVRWLNRGRPDPLRIDGHAYRRRIRARRRHR